MFYLWLSSVRINKSWRVWIQPKCTEEGGNCGFVSVLFINKLPDTRIYLNRFANIHICISTSMRLSNSVEQMMRGNARDKTCLERDRWTEKWTEWTVNSIQETIWVRKIWTCWEKSTLSLLDRVRDTRLETHMHPYLCRNTPMWIPVWKKNPSSCKRSPSERNRRKLSSLRVLSWKGTELLHV